MVNFFGERREVINKLKEFQNDVLNQTHLFKYFFIVITLPLLPYILNMVWSVLSLPGTNIFAAFNEEFFRLVSLCFGWFSLIFYTLAIAISEFFIYTLEYSTFPEIVNIRLFCILLHITAAIVQASYLIYYSKKLKLIHFLYCYLLASAIHIFWNVYLSKMIYIYLLVKGGYLI